LRRRRPETSWEPELSPAIQPTDTAQEAEETALLQRALMGMPEEKREVLVLSRFQDLKYEEIAQLMGCEVGTVKTRVHRALQELREIFFRLQGGKTSRREEGAGNRPGSGSVQ
jgi:RNA polymerase sigma-70 factor (ECF subfamily)